MSDIQGQIVLAENSAGNGLQRLKLNSAGLLRVVAEATSVSANQIDLNTDGLEGLIGSTNTALATIDGVLDNAEAHLGAIDTGINVLEACVGSNKVNVNISSGNITGFATATNQSTIIGHIDGVESSLTAITGYVDGIEGKQDTMITHMDGVEGLLTTIDADTDAIKTSAAAMVVDLAAIEVINNNAEVHLGNIDTGVDVLEACVGSNKVNVNISSGNISGFSTASNQSTIIGHLDGVEGKLDTLETTLTAIETDMAAIETINTNAETHLGNIDTGVDVLEACVGSNKVNVNISSGNISGFSTASNQSTIIGHLDGVEGKLDTLETTLTAIETDQAAIEVLHTATNQKLDDIETAVQLIDDAIKTEDLAHSSGDKGIPCLMVRQDSHTDLAADGDYMIPTINANGEIRVTSTAASGGATEAKQDDLIGHLDGVEGKLDHLSDNLDTLETTLSAIETDQAAIEVLLTAANTDHAANEALLTTIDADTDAIKTSTAACATDLAALEVLQTATNSKLDDIETAVQLIDNGYGDMTTATIMNASVAESSGEGVSSTFTKTREIENIGFAITAPSNASYSAFIEYSVDNSLFFQDTNLNFANTLSCKGTITSIGRGFRYFRVRIINNHNAAQTFVVKISY